MVRFCCALALLALPVSLQASSPDLEEKAASQVHAAAQAWLAAQYPSLMQRLEVRVLRLSRDLQDTLTAAAPPLRIEAPTRTALPRARTQVTILAGTEAAGWTKLGWAMLYVAHYDSVLVPTRQLPADEPLAAADLRTAWVETTTFRGEPLGPSELRKLLRDDEVFASRTLREGRPLQRTDVRPPYAADIGEAVVMRFQRRRIALMLPCKAREPGYAGDVIRVYSPDTKTTYRVRLTDDGAADWIETL